MAWGGGGGGRCFCPFGVFPQIVSDAIQGKVSQRRINYGGGSSGPDSES